MFFVSVWGAVLQTRFGAVWIWQIILALVTLAVVVIAPVKMQRRLLILTVAQFILLAGVGHATMRDGVAGTLQQINHALHLLCAAALVWRAVASGLLYAHGSGTLASTCY